MSFRGGLNEIIFTLSNIVEFNIYIASNLITKFNRKKKHFDVIRVEVFHVYMIENFFCSMFVFLLLSHITWLCHLT